jgi:hypothetical protein
MKAIFLTFIDSKTKINTQSKKKKSIENENANWIFIRASKKSQKLGNKSK